MSLKYFQRVVDEFRVLQAMPTEFLWDEVSIRDADASVIIPLLLQIRRVFGHHLKRS